MKKLLLALAALAFSSAVSAAPLVSATYNLNATNSVQYVGFSVAADSNFDISVSGTLDPRFYLFGGVLGDFTNPLAPADTTYGGMSATQLFLTTGAYFLAVSDDYLLGFDFSAAQDGTNLAMQDCLSSQGTDCGNGDVLVSVADIGQYVPPTSVPEPASLFLIGLGLAGLATVRRRKLV